MTKERLTSNQWGALDRLNWWIESHRERGDIGMAERVDFELVKEWQAEIKRLTEVYRREREAHAANLKEQQKCEAEIERLRAALEWFIRRSEDSHNVARDALRPGVETFGCANVTKDK